MRILLLELMSGGGVLSTGAEASDGSVHTSLANEGMAMLSALVNDALRIQDVEVDVFLASHQGQLDLPESRKPNVHVVRIESPQQFFEQAVVFGASADVTIAIAPESNGLLCRLADLLRTNDVSVLLPTMDQIQWASDKRQTAAVLADHQIPTPPCLDGAQLSVLSGEMPVVVKPIDGAGCQQTTQTTISELKTLEPDFLVQPFQKGTNISVSVIAGENPILLPPVYQRIEADGEALVYCGGDTRVSTNHAQRAHQLAQKCLPLFNGASGWLGIDMILGEHPKDDVVIEINPRMTTSFCALSQIAEESLVQAMIKNSQGFSCLATVEPDGKHAVFDASGDVLRCT